MPKYRKNNYSSINNRSINECLYCKNKATTKDHTPSKFLCGNTSENKITVPCCLECNQFFSKLEDKCKNIIIKLCHNPYELISELDLRIMDIVFKKNALGILYNAFECKLNPDYFTVSYFSFNQFQDIFRLPISQNVDDIGAGLPLILSMGKAEWSLNGFYNKIGDIEYIVSYKPYTVKFQVKNVFGVKVNYVI
ncbi:MAG: hypothetical protein J1F38_10690 [Muribaculaceae bacterium]|nr:hypothetical protein [Muribaculaceae bacterium]